MNCGPATIDVRGVFDAADAEYAAAAKHALVTPDEARAMRDAVRGMMVRMGLYELWQNCRPEDEKPCPVCGCEERGQGGYLACQCPAKP